MTEKRLTFILEGNRITLGEAYPPGLLDDLDFDPDMYAPGDISVRFIKADKEDDGKDGPEREPE